MLQIFAFSMHVLHKKKNIMHICASMLNALKQIQGVRRVSSTADLLHLTQGDEHHTKAFGKDIFLVVYLCNLLREHCNNILT